MYQTFLDLVKKLACFFACAEGCGGSHLQARKERVRSSVDGSFASGRSWKNGPLDRTSVRKMHVTNMRTANDFTYYCIHDVAFLLIVEWG